MGVFQQNAMSVVNGADISLINPSIHNKPIGKGLYVNGPLFNK
jgi:hypothetical protein